MDLASFNVSDEPDRAVVALSSRLPADVSLSISRVLAPAQSEQPQQQAQQPREAPSLTTQLSALFPSAETLTPTSIERKQAQIRQELAVQERYIESLLKRLLQRQAALRERAENGNEYSVGQPLSSKDLDEKVHVLLDQLGTIRAKAHRSEEIVREITRDIRMLDTCKRNVVNSMTALKRLQMLVNAVAQLERLTKTNRFREAASSLSAVQSLLESFDGYAGVERVASIQREVAALQQDLGQKARAEFETYFTKDNNHPPVRSTAVPDAALVIDALGAEARASLIEFYTSHQLREYRRIFRATDEAGQLDNVARRFAWFRRILKTYDEEHAAVFEEGPLRRWSVARELTRKFTEVTRQDIRSVLIRTQGKLQVPVLLEALTASLDFEKTMSRRFGIPFAQISSNSEAAASAVLTTQTQQSSTTLSSTFDPYLGMFVEAQDRTLNEMIQTFRRQGTRVSMDEGATDATNRDGHQYTVLPSSTELFYFYGSVLEQCSRLSTRQPFRDLCGVYKKHLLAYAEEVLKPLLQRPEPSIRRSSADTRSSLADLQRLCLVINTADYCAMTCRQLEEKLKEKIDAEFRSAVDLEAERDVFMAVILAGVQALTREMEVSVDRAFQQMLREPWSTLDADATDVKSAYIDEYAGALEHVAVVVRQDVQSKRYVRNWCDKVVGVVLSRFMLNIVKLKPVTPLAAQQMLTDLAEVRTSLLELPRYSLSDEGSTSAASSYNRYVSKGVGRIETLLKLIAVPDETADLLIDTYVRLVGDRSFSNFQKVLDIKGIRKADQNTLMDAFVSKTSQSEDPLEESSFLTTLDMDSTVAAASSMPSSVAMSPDTSLGGAAAGLLSFMGGGGGSSDGVGTGTPPMGSTPRYAASLGLGSLTSSSSPSGARSGGKSTVPTDAVGAGAQRALSDLRRFGSMLVGRREASSSSDSRGR